jgi:hypothetical protein
VKVARPVLRGPGPSNGLGLPDRANHELSRVSVSFDETNLVPSAGLLPAAVLAQRIDLAGLIDRRLHLVRTARTAARRRCQ